MKLTAIPTLPFTVDPGWTEIDRIHPRLARLYAGVVLPLSLLPPALLYLKGAAFFSPWLPEAAHKDWAVLALAFFITELISLIVMGWFIREAAAMNDLAIDDHDAFLLAGVAPIPLWLSSLGLLTPGLGFNVALSMAAFALSCGIIHNGVAGLAHTRETVQTAAVAHAVMSAGLMAWILLLLVIVL